MTPRQRGLLLGAIQCVLVVSLGAKLLVDRARLPRVWVRTAPIDPDLPIRGRYVRLRLETRGDGFLQDTAFRFVQVGARLEVRGDSLVAIADARGPIAVTVSDSGRIRLAEPVAYFIPEHVPDPSRRAPGEELWVEVTVPRAGPPRPLRLGVRRGGDVTPLDR